MRVTLHDSPLGPLLLASDEVGLRLLRFDPPATLPVDWQVDPQAHAELRAQLDAYFAGHLRGFTQRLTPQGTDFQRAVWAALEDIPYGTTTTYAALARRIGQPRAVRAVGAANGANPIAILLPCHRVIGADGSLTGYGGGLPRKVTLLRLEGALRQGALPLG